MKIYDQLRCDFTVAMARFTDQHQDDKKITAKREKDMQALHKIINHHDDISDAFMLSQALRNYVSNMGFAAFSWMRSLSIYQLKFVLAQVLNKAKYNQVRLLRTMYQEEKTNTARVEESLETKMKKMQSVNADNEQKLLQKLRSAEDEIVRLKREIRFLTDKLVDCRKKLKSVEAALISATQVNNSQLVMYNGLVNDSAPAFQQPPSQMAILVRQSDLWQQKQPQTAVPYPHDVVSAPDARAF